MKWSLDRFGNIFKICLLAILLIHSAFNVRCGLASESKRGKDILADFDYLVSQLYLQHCTFVEIGEGVCSMFVELTLDSGCKRPRPLRKQMFFGNCLCSEFRKWHLCSYPLTQLRPEDCEFHEGSTCPSSSARVHRRLCDVTGMSQWNPQCNCSVTLAGNKQEHLCGFKTCYANPMPKAICGPRTVCGTAHCDVGEHGSLYSVRCDRRCRHHQPFCEDPCPATSLKRSVSSQWAEWKPASSRDGEGSMQQFETECLDEKNEPAFDCLGPGLLCCSKEDSDCICEVKMQDGKLKAFRYMIKFGDDGKQCEPNSKLKVRSTGLKGDAKVWDRFIGAASRDDDKNDSVSMFGKPVGFEAYLRKSRPEEQKEIVAGNMKVALQEPGMLKEGLLQHLVMLMTNRSQGLKSSEKLNVSDSKIVQGNRLKGESSNGTIKLVNEDSMWVPVTQTLNSVIAGSPGDKQQVNSNTNQLQITSNNSQSNISPTLENQQKDTQQTGKLTDIKHPNNLTPFAYQNVTNKAEILERNASNEKILAERVQNISHDVNEKSIIDATSLEDRSKIDENVNTNNANSKHQNSSMEKHDQKNKEKESDRAMIDELRDISNTTGVKTEDASKVVASINQSSRNTTSSNENNKDKIQSSLQPIETNTENKIITSAPQVKETETSKEKPESIKHSENHQNILTGQEDRKDDKKIEGKINDNSQHAEGKVLNQGKKIENDRQENGTPSERVLLQSTNSDKKSPDAKSKVATQNSPEKNPKDKSKINTDKSQENPSQNSKKIEKVANKQEFLLGGILVSENKAKGQENSSVDEEDKVELKENEYQQEVVPAQDKQQNNEQGKKEIELSVTPKLINKEFTNAVMKISSKGNIVTERVVNNLPTEKLMSSSFAKESAFTLVYKPTASLSQPKQIDISNVTNSDNFTNVGLQSSNISEISGNNQQNSENSQLIETEKIANISQKNNISSLISSPDKEASIKQQALDKKVKFNDIANIFPNYSPQGITVPSMSSKRRPKPSYLREVGETGVTLNIQTIATPDLLGAIANKLFKSNSLNDPNDPLRMLSESNPSISLPEEKQSHDYDEPEPVLKDLNKVDKENVDEKMAEALSKLADLKELEGKVEWSEKSENNNIKLDFGKEKKVEDSENVSPSENMPTLSVGDVKKKRRRSKFKKS